MKRPRKYELLDADGNVVGETTVTDGRRKLEIRTARAGFIHAIRVTMDDGKTAKLNIGFPLRLDAGQGWEADGLKFGWLHDTSAKHPGKLIERAAAWLAS